MDKLFGNDLAIVATKARLLAVDAVHTASSGHPGGSLSCMDALVSLYFNEMNLDPTRPDWADRDRFVLSKGHCAPALYAVLALRGYFDPAELKKLRSIDSHMSGHPDMRYIPGVDMSTGSLGQGLSTAVYRTYAICGDGEIDEGQIWEAAMAAAKWKLDNLCAFVDVNGLQIDGTSEEVMPTEPLDAKFAAFNWHVIKVNGHDYAAILAALAEARQTKGKPTMILLATTKGKGVSFMEGQCGWHGKAPDDALFAQAKQELEATLRQLEGK